ncbi:hypothetical protein WDU94_010058 [Cyamophila willieti]
MEELRSPVQVPSMRDSLLLESIDMSDVGLDPIPNDDDELFLPRASINKIIKELLPNIRVANESRELVMNCCMEFIHLISSEANEICNQQQKKTIIAEHVLQALETLGFSDYINEAQEVMKDCKIVAANRRRQSNRLENLGIPEEELLRQQQELFAKAREEQAAADLTQWQQIQEITSQQKPTDEADFDSDDDS